MKGEHCVSFTAGETYNSRGLQAASKLGQAAEVEGRVMSFIDELFKLSHRGALCV